MLENPYLLCSKEGRNETIVKFNSSKNECSNYNEDIYESILGHIFEENEIERKPEIKYPYHSNYKTLQYKLIMQDLSKELREPQKLRQIISHLNTPLTQEKIKLFQRYAELTNLFGIEVPHNLTKEEIDKLNREGVNHLARRWFLFLRSQGIQFELPESMNGQFSVMMDCSARAYVEQRYCVSTKLPLDKLLEVTRLNLEGQLMGRVIQIAEGIKIEKNFPLGKVYKTVPISGLRERISPLEATTLLIYGLIGRKRKNVKAAYEAFEKGKLESARRDLEGSHLSREKIFGEISQYLVQLSKGDTNAAIHILDYIQQALPTEEISDLVAGVRCLFTQERGFSHLDIRMQDGVYDDLFNNNRFMCCTFLPSGIYKEATFGYYHDPDVGLLHIVPRDIETRLDSIGVSILINAMDENGRKWLVVDSVEGGEDLERVRETLWIPAMYESIIGVATDIDAKNVIFNSEVHNGRPKTLLKYVAKKHSNVTINLQKMGITDYSYLGISPRHAKKAFETWGDGGNDEAKGYVVEVQK